jgi:hypothetical protein
VVRRVARDYRPGRDRLHKLFHGAVTIVAFSEAGRMRRLRLSNRLLAVSVLLLLTLLVGAAVSVFQLYRGQVDLARMAYLEGENRALTTLLQGQAEHLGRLKLELDRLKEFEQNLRIVSGIDSPAEVGGGGQPAAGTPPVRKR